MSEDKDKVKAKANNSNILDKKVDKDRKEVESHDRYNTDIIKGIFLLVLVVAGNYVGETLGCQTQNAMTDSVYVKHAIILMLIYFTINFTSSDNPHPFNMIKKTLIIWAMYLMFSRMDSGFTLSAVVLLMVYYILSNFTDYHTTVYRNEIESADTAKEKNGLEQDYYLIEKQYQDLREYILYVLIIVVIIGFALDRKSVV